MITSNTMSSGGKEEGELSDDDCENEAFEQKKDSRQIIVKDTSTKQSLSKYDPKDDLYHFKSKRRDGRNRRPESNNLHRSHRYGDEGNNKHRQEHDAGAKAQSENHPQSKMWQKRRFRASSVRPLTPPKHIKPQILKMTGSPNTEPVEPHYESTEDELVQLEMRQALIQSQLKHLEEAEKAFENTDIGKKKTQKQTARTESVRKSLSNGGALTMTVGDASTIEIESEKSIIVDDEEGDDELRRLALATSERHIRLLDTLTQKALPGNLVDKPVEELVDIIDLVNEEEEEKAVHRSKKPPKDKSSPSTKTKKNVTKGQTAARSKKRTDPKSTVQKVNQIKNARDLRKDPPPGRPSKRTNNQSDKANWREYKRLRQLAAKDPQLAVEQFLGLIRSKEPKISATGTMKDFKRQMKIPVLSEKHDILNKKVTPKKVLDSKGTRKSLDKKSGQLEDNYDEVAMEIDSDAEKEEKPSPLDKLQLGAHFMQAMQPIMPYNFNIGPIRPFHHQSLPSAVPPFMNYHMLPVPPLPPPPPPPPPPPEDNSADFAQGHFLSYPPPPYQQKSLAPAEESIVRQIHQLRELSEELKVHSLGHIPASKTQELNAVMQRFVFSETASVPSREKTEYALLENFNTSDPVSKVGTRLVTRSTADVQLSYSPLHEDRNLKKDEQDFIIHVRNNSGGRRKVHQLSQEILDSSIPPYLRSSSDSNAERLFNKSDSDGWDGSQDSQTRSSLQSSSRHNRYSPWPASPPAGVVRHPKDNFKVSSETADLTDYYHREKYQYKISADTDDKGYHSPRDGHVRDIKIYKRRHPSFSPESTFSLYEPQAPPSKQKKYSSPPPYIPTSIKTPRDSRLSDNRYGTESEEEDDHIMREKLLATVIVKRKSKLEDLSNSSSPYVLSPKLPVIYPEERTDYVDTNENVLSTSNWHKDSLYGDETDDEDIQPPPVLSRLVYSSRQPLTLAVLCKLTMLKSQSAGSNSSESNFKDAGDIATDSNIKPSDESLCDPSKQVKITDNDYEAESSVSKKLNKSTTPGRLDPSILHRLGPETSTESSDILKRLGPKISLNFTKDSSNSRNILLTPGHLLGQTMSKSPERLVSLGENSKEDSLTDKIDRYLSVLREKTEHLVGKNSSLLEAKSMVVKTASQLGQARQVLIQDTVPHSNQTYQQRRPFNNPQMLPIHPQVLVPLISTDSEDEDVKEMSRGGAESFSKTHSLMNSRSSKTEVDEYEYLKKEETYLTFYKQKIYKEQAMVKQLLEKAVKFVKAQQQAELKKNKLQGQMTKLSEQLRIAEKIANSYKTQKEKTEKEVQSLTETLVKTKNLLREKEASVVTLGKKLFGPNYMPKLTKPSEHVTKENLSSEMVSLTRAEYIAQEKQKLKEKEKEISEKLHKLKELKSSEKRDATKFQSKVKLNRSTPRSQDLIKIDPSAKPDFVAKSRRKSLIDTNACTTPNIPMTPRSRLTSKGGLLSEVSQEAVDSKVIQSVHDGEVKTYKLPSGTQLSHLCQLQAEKMEKYKKSFHSISKNQFFTNITKPSSTKLLICSEEQKLEGSKLDSMRLPPPFTYTSSLLMFKSYRLSSFFRTKESLGFQSTTYSNKINPHCIFCPYDLQGTCNDDSCQQQHPTDYKLNERELLEDIVSYCPKLAGVTDGASPQEIQKCVGSYVDNVLSKRRGKMSIDELCVWLSAEVKSVSGKSHPFIISLESRRWKPASKEETGLSLHLNQRLTNKGVESINTERLVDKDAVINDEDVRYFAVDAADLLSLEAEIMKDKTNSDLWQRLAFKKLTDPNKTPEECLDQALNVLARGLEENRHDSILWLNYLQLYKKHSESQNFIQFCQTALDLAPTYDLWFLFISSLHTFNEKDEACNQALEYIWKVGEQKPVSNPNQPPKSGTDDILSTNQPTREAAAFWQIDSTVALTGDVLMEDKEEGQSPSNAKVTDMTEGGQDIPSASSVEGDPKCVTSSNLASIDQQIMNSARRRSATETNSRADSKTSHQLLEMILIKVGLNLHAGKYKTALHFIQAALCIKKVDHFTAQFSKLLSTADKLSLWLVYLYLLEWHHLPPTLYSDFNQNPGKLLAKDNISIHWSTKMTPHTSLDTLVKLHKKAFEVWTKSERDSASTSLYIKLVQSLISLLVTQEKSTDAVAVCRHILSHNKHLVDIWLTLTDLIAATSGVGAVRQVFQEALDANKFCSKLQFYQNLYLTLKGETEVALFNLEQFVISHFDASSTNLQMCDPNLLYCQLLKQDEAFSLKMAKVKEELPNSLHKDIYLWLCYNLLMELEGESLEACEIYENILTHAQSSDDLLVIWQNYIQYMVRSGTGSKNIKDLLCRSLLSMPTKRPIPFSSSPSATWVDYSSVNQLVELWMEVLPVFVKLDMMEMCLAFLPGDIHLLLRFVDLCLELTESKRAYSLCKMIASQSDKPANGAFWKMAVALAHSEGTRREVEQMLIGCVETMPLAVAGWKDFLLLEVSCENLGAIEILLRHCRQLGLNIEGFVSTISAPISGKK